MPAPVFEGFINGFFDEFFEGFVKGFVVKGFVEGFVGAFIAGLFARFVVAFDPLRSFPTAFRSAARFLLRSILEIRVPASARRARRTLPQRGGAGGAIRLAIRLPTRLAIRPPARRRPGQRLP